MDDMLLTPSVSSSTITDAADDAVFTTSNTKVITWAGTSQTLKVYGQDAKATPSRYNHAARQVNAVYPSPIYNLYAPVSALGLALEYQPGVGSGNIVYWPTIARRVVTAPTFSARRWTGGEIDYLEVNATAMRDHMNMPCTFEMDAETQGEIDSWSYDIQPTHHGWQGLYSADPAGLRSESVAIEQCAHANKNPQGDYRLVSGSNGQKLLHHLPTNDILAGIGVIAPFGTVGSFTYFHRAPTVYRVRAWATRQVATGAGDPGPPSALTIQYRFLDAAYNGTLQSVTASFTRSGAMYTVGAYDYYGYIADLSVDPLALSPPAGSVGFYIYQITGSFSGKLIIEQKLALNFPYCASPGILTPSVYFPGRGIKLGTLPT